MADTYDLVLQGTEESDKLKAHRELNDQQDGYDYFTIVHGAGGDDMLGVDPNLRFYYSKGVELDGDEGNDELSDTAQGDTLSGGLGDDIIKASAGRDVIDGGEDDDTLFTAGNLDRLTVTGVEHLVARGPLRVGTFDLNAFESIELVGHSSITFSNATTFDAQNLVGNHLELLGSKESDLLDLSAVTAVAEIKGNGGDDKLLGGSGHNVIDGGGGADDILGGVGKDELNGSGGNDTVDGGGGNGDDKISGETIYDYDNYPIRSTGNKLFDGGAGNDLFENLHNLTGYKVTLIGGQGDDTLEFHGDASKLSVSGIETLDITFKVSRPHFDLSMPLKASGEFLESFKHIVRQDHNPDVKLQLELTSADDFHWRDAQTRLSGDMLATKHADEIDMSKARGHWTISSGDGNDTVKASAGGSKIDGGDGNDTLIGGGDGDQINDGAGNDVINGGGGKDLFYEQGGANTFVFQAGSGNDYLYGFDLAGSDKDKIDLSAVSSITSFSDLIDHHIDEKFNGLFIDFGGKDRLWLDGVANKDALDASMFIF